MFTGIIQETGIVKKISPGSSGYKLEIKAYKAGKGLPPGGSIAVNGVCLSVVEKNNLIVFDVMLNTYKNTNLKRLKPGSIVNLEEALRSGQDISGHIVSGHIDGERKILKNRRSSEGWILEVEIYPEDDVFVVQKGSIAINGVSLTIAELKKKYVRIGLIPITLEHSNLVKLKTGDFVNVEFDAVAKYANKRENIITKDFLARKGFI